MNRPNRKPLNPASLAANGKQGFGAKDGQVASVTHHSSPADVMALYLLLHTRIASAQRVIAHLAVYADWAPAGLIEAADLVDRAGDLVATIVATGGAQ